MWCIWRCWKWWRELCVFIIKSRNYGNERKCMNLRVLYPSHKESFGWHPNEKIIIYGLPKCPHLVCVSKETPINLSSPHNRRLFTVTFSRAIAGPAPWPRLTDKDGDRCGSRRHNDIRAKVGELFDVVFKGALTEITIILSTISFRWIMLYQTKWNCKMLYRIGAIQLPLRVFINCVCTAFISVWSEFMCTKVYPYNKMFWTA